MGLAQATAAQVVNKAVVPQLQNNGVYKGVFHVIFLAFANRSYFLK